MVFTEPRFLVFFAVVFALHWALRSNRSRKALLLVASYFFYGAWDWRFLFLIFASTVIDYVAARCIAAATSPARRRSWLVVSLVANLGLLGFFKYFNFFVESGVGLLHLLGLQVEAHTLAIVLPVGISFFTFQTMSYSIDVYRGNLPPVRSFWDFALFVAFFPQLVAGPIVRAATFLPQLEHQRSYHDVAFRAATGMFLAGFIKKACIADQIAASVDLVFAHPEQFTALAQVTALCLYAIQIYCDFSGYSEMAIACAMALGFELPANFDFPYFAASVTDFWRRWHISLSTWLRDYLYIPLGGNRGSRLFTYRNLLLTMLLGGLWHGAGWNFVIWGALHGLALIANREWNLRVAVRIPWPIGWLLTLFLVLIAWVFFRAQTFADAVTMMRALLLFDSAGTRTLAGSQLLLVLGLLGAHAVGFFGVMGAIGRRLPMPVLAFVWGVIAALALLFVPLEARPFIYFQF